MLELWMIVVRWRFYLWKKYLHVLQVARILKGDGEGFSIWKKFHKIPAFRLGSSVDVSADHDVDSSTWPSNLAQHNRLRYSSGVCIWWGFLPKHDHNCTWMSCNGWTEKVKYQKLQYWLAQTMKCDWHTCPTAILMKNR